MENRRVLLVLQPETKTLMKRIQTLLLISILAIAGCQTKYEIVETPSVPMDSTLFAQAEALPELQDDAIDEASGLVASVQTPGAFWTHNDSGGKAQLFLVSSEGKTLTTVTLEGIKARDWEDIALHVEDSIPYLYIAEMGDNRAQYEDKYLYRFAEPLASQTSVAQADITTIPFAYPEHTRDAETLLIDPLTGDIVIVSKREEFSRVYELKAPFSTDTVNILTWIGELPFRNAVGGDVSANGEEVLVKTYDEVFLWKRTKGASLAQTLTQPAVRIPYLRELQGEAIAWNREGTAFFTLSEESNEIAAKLYRYVRQTAR